MLRYDSPVQMLLRFAQRDTEVGGTRIEAGAVVAVIFGAANRDPAKFSEPEQFDVAREPNDHLAFGDGIHFCIGAPLARLEARDRVRGDGGAIRDYRAGRAVGAAVVSRIVRHARAARAAADRRVSLTPALPAFRSCRTAPAQPATSANSCARRGPAFAKPPGR